MIYKVLHRLIVFQSQLVTGRLSALMPSFSQGRNQYCQKLHNLPKITQKVISELTPELLFLTFRIVGINFDLLFNYVRKLMIFLYPIEQKATSKEREYHSSSVLSDSSSSAGSVLEIQQHFHVYNKNNNAYLLALW